VIFVLFISAPVRFSGLISLQFSGLRFNQYQHFCKLVDFKGFFPLT
jgi:hypothetical protein